MGVWVLVYGCMGVWVLVYGCMGVWVYGCMGVWVYGCMGVWVYGCMGVWVRRMGSGEVVWGLVVSVMGRSETCMHYTSTV
jgi:erythrocyte membrane protein 1